MMIQCKYSSKNIKCIYFKCLRAYIFLNWLKSINTATKVMTSLLLCGCETSKVTCLRTSEMPACLVHEHEHNSRGEDWTSHGGKEADGQLLRYMPAFCLKSLSSQLSVFGWEPWQKKKKKVSIFCDQVRKACWLS